MSNNGYRDHMDVPSSIALRLTEAHHYATRSLLTSIAGLVFFPFAIILAAPALGALGLLGTIFSIETGSGLALIALALIALGIFLFGPVMLGPLALKDADRAREMGVRADGAALLAKALMVIGGVTAVLVALGVAGVLMTDKEGLVLDMIFGP